ncbi:hypothetical protein QR685DRAFT_576160 [Neurospora intermedia]|uniref:Secreted protein n=1 Tax=Neurospora intermedia TaxID=5142 RepID=A0ABR3D024_NEUIN
MLFGCVTAAVTLVDGHGAQTRVEASKKRNGHLMARLVPSRPSLRWMVTFAVPADKKLPASITDPLFGPSPTPGSRHNPTRPPSSLEPLKLEYPYPLPPFGNVVKRCRFSYLRISLPCEPNRKPKSHYAGCSVH